MKRALLTGMSGVGKSTILKALKTIDNITIDLDDDNWIYFDNQLGDYLLDVPRVLDLFKTNHTKEIFLAGTTINQNKIYPHLDYVITLVASIDVMKSRIEKRIGNPFGKSDEEWEKIILDKKEVEPLLIKGSDFVISTEKELKYTITEIRNLMN